MLTNLLSDVNICYQIRRQINTPEVLMVDDPKITERDGKKFCTLPNGNQVEIEDEIINNPNWVNVEDAVKIIRVGDRQIRNLADKNSWDKKYAYINKKPVAYYLKSQLENFQRSRITDVLTSSAVHEPESKPQENPNPEKTVGQNLITQHALEDIDSVVKKLQPYIGDFLETYKKNQERIIALEDKRTSAEKSAVLWKTSAIWIAVLGVVAGGSWFKLSQTNSLLFQSNSNLSEKYESTQSELYSTKLSLTQTQHELDMIKQQQNNSSPTTNSVTH